MKNFISLIAFILLLSLSTSAQLLQSKYGYSLPVAGDNVQTTVKVMVVFAERVDGCPSADFNNNANTNWTPGSLPSDADNYFDAQYISKYSKP